MHIPSTHILSLSSLGFHGPHQELYTDLPDVQQAPGMGGDDMHEKAATDESLARVSCYPGFHPLALPPKWKTMLMWLPMLMVILWNRKTCLV